MSKSNTFENELLLHIFQNADITLIGDAGGLLGSVADGSLYVSLHTGDPGEAGDQSTNECDYTGYARTAVARTSGGWTVASNNASNAAEVTWGEKTAGADDTATYFGVGTSSAGATKLLYSGALTASLLISNGITPTAAIGDLDVTED